MKFINDDFYFICENPTLEDLKTLELIFESEFYPYSRNYDILKTENNEVEIFYLRSPIMGHKNIIAMKLFHNRIACRNLEQFLERTDNQNLKKTLLFNLDLFA